MERAAFIVVVTFAVFFAMWHYWGAPHFSWSSDAPFERAEAMLPTARAHVPAATYVATSLNIENAAAQVTVTPEDRADISIEIDNPGHTPTPTVTLANGVVSIDGHLRGRIGDCDNGGVSLRGYDDVSAEQMPHIIVHAPKTLTISANGGAYTTIGPAQDLHASFAGCATSQIADVAGPLAVSLSGSGTVRAGAAHSLDAKLMGSGDVFTGAIAGDAATTVNGSGALTVGSVTGALTAANHGSGDLVVEGGAITTAHVSMAGSGDARLAATIHDLNVEIIGSGDVEVPAAAVNVSADIVGSGSVRVKAASGQVNRQIVGSGDLKVGD